MLNNKTVIVTGGGSGLGEAACRMFAENGYKVVVADNNFEEAIRVHTSIQKAGYESIPIRVDVTDRESVKSMVRDVLNAYGTIEVLLNNAGIVLDKTLLKLPDEWFDKVIDVNLKGVYNCAKYVTPHMVEKGFGRIINISSVVRNGNRGQTSYSATKNAVVAMSNTWAREFATKGITSNCVAPGFMKTNMTAGMKPEALAATEQMIPMKRLGKPEDIARACLFLASEDSDYITGAVLDINGGLVI